MNNSDAEKIYYDWDEIPFVRNMGEYDDVDRFDEEQIEDPLNPDEEEADLEELFLDDEISPLDAPTPYNLLRLSRSEVKRSVTQILQEDGKKRPETPVPPHMPPVHPFDTPDPMALISAGVMLARKPEEEKKEDEHEPAPVPAPTQTESLGYETWFESGSVEQSERPEEPVMVQKKPSFFSKLGSKLGAGLGNAMEKLGTFLDRALPIGSFLTLGVIALAGHQQMKNLPALVQPARVEQAAAAPVSVVPASLAPKEIKSSASTLWEKYPDPVRLNSVLVKQNVEIVKKAGGKDASYLYNSQAFTHFTASLRGKGYDTVLNNHEVKKAKNIAEMVNIVDQVFGEKVADLIESNAAAMHLSAGAIASI